jgi:hypothetical protein
VLVRLPLELFLGAAIWLVCCISFKLEAVVWWTVVVNFCIIFSSRICWLRFLSVWLLSTTSRLPIETFVWIKLVPIKCIRSNMYKWTESEAICCSVNVLKGSMSLFVCTSKCQSLLTASSSSKKYQKAAFYFSNS